MKRFVIAVACVLIAGVGTAGLKASTTPSPARELTNVVAVKGNRVVHSEAFLMPSPRLRIQPSEPAAFKTDRFGPPATHS